MDNRGVHLLPYLFGRSLRRWQTHAVALYDGLAGQLGVPTTSWARDEPDEGSKAAS